jgi:hypothetical protein
LVLQSDNGGEFTAAVLMEMLNDLYPHCTTVNGRARTPRDRGSVEKGNDTVKKKLQSVVQDRRQQGKDANWVELLPQVMPAMNAHCTQIHATIPYNHVYGMNYFLLTGPSLKR